MDGLHIPPSAGTSTCSGHGSLGGLSVLTEWVLRVATDADSSAASASVRVPPTYVPFFFFFLSNQLLRFSVFLPGYRLEIQEILRGFLCTVIALTPEDLPPCVYLACNQVIYGHSSVDVCSCLPSAY